MTALIALGKAIAAALFTAVEVTKNLMVWLSTPTGQAAVGQVITIISMTETLIDLLQASFAHFYPRKVVASWPAP